MNASMKSKTCNKCKQVLDASLFRRSKYGKLGRRSFCRSCERSLERAPLTSRRVGVPAVDRIRARTVVVGDCHIWTGATSGSGYGQIFDGGRLVVTHRIMWESASGRSVPDGLDLLHSCDTRLCCNPDHLRPGTRAENMQDAIDRNRVRHGEGTPSSKLTADQVLLIVSASLSGETAGSIAARFKVCRWTVNQILYGKQWARVTGILRKLA